MTKLTPEDIRLIALAKAEKIRLDKESHELTNRVLARKFGVSAVTVHRIPAADSEEWEAAYGL